MDNKILVAVDGSERCDASAAAIGGLFKNSPDHRLLLLHKGVVSDSIHTRIEETKEGISRDLLNDIAYNQYQIVVIGKKSFKKRVPFLIGSHANKLLHHVKQSILCVVG